MSSSGVVRAWKALLTFWPLDLTAHGLQAVYAPLAGGLTCDLCKMSLHARLEDAISRWVSVRVSPHPCLLPSASTVGSLTYVIRSAPSSTRPRRTKNMSPRTLMLSM